MHFSETWLNTAYGYLYTWGLIFRQHFARGRCTFLPFERYNLLSGISTFCMVWVKLLALLGFLCDATDPSAGSTYHCQFRFHDPEEVLDQSVYRADRNVVFRVGRIHHAILDGRFHLAFWTEKKKQELHVGKKRGSKSAFPKNTFTRRSERTPSWRFLHKLPIAGEYHLYTVMLPAMGSF